MAGELAKILGERTLAAAPLVALVVSPFLLLAIAKLGNYDEY